MGEDINPEIIIPETLKSLLPKRQIVSRKILQDYIVTERFGGMNVHCISIILDRTFYVQQGFNLIEEATLYTC